MKRRLLVCCLLLAVVASGFAVPPGLFDPTYDGGIAGGVLFSIDPLNGRMQLGFELYWLSRSRVGVGFTSFANLSNPLSLDSFSLDGLYYLDFDPTGNGYAVIPIKLRLGIFGGHSDLGIGLASGIEYYALPMFFDANDNIVFSGDPNLSGFFLTVKALAELDYWGGKLTPWVMGGATLIGTIGGEGNGDTYYYYYYY